MNIFDNYMFFLIQQIKWLTLVLVFMLIISQVNYQVLKKIAYGLLIFSWIIILMGYFFTGGNSASRWLVIGGSSWLTTSDLGRISLIIFTAFGLICSIGAFAVGLIVIVSTLVYGIDVSGWASIMLSIYFIGGLIITNLGIIGYYVGKSFDETKKRPIYLIGEQVNID